MTFKSIKQLEKEIEELRDKANTLELDKEDIYSGDLIRMHTKLDNLNPLLEQTKAIKKMIENNPNFFLNDDAQELLLSKLEGEEK